jgi:hypothetical protein
VLYKRKKSQKQDEINLKWTAERSMGIFRCCRACLYSLVVSISIKQVPIESGERTPILVSTVAREITGPAYRK